MTGLYMLLFSVIILHVVFRGKVCSAVQRRGLKTYRGTEIIEASFCPLKL